MEIITIAPKAKRSGMIMPLVATIVVFIFLIGIAMLKIGFGSRFIAARTSSEITARSAADAGLTMAMHRMTPGILPYSLEDYPVQKPGQEQNIRTTFSYKVEIAEFPADPMRRFRIRSVGTSDNISKTVYAMTWATSFWSYAIAVDDTIAFHSKIVLDVWDPDGKYPNLTPTIATTSTESGAVTLFPNTEIPGDVVVGAGSDVDSVVDSKASSVINGDIYAADSDIDFPDVTLPEGLPPLALWPGDPCSVLDTGLYAYSSINLGNSERLEITGNVVMYVDGLMRLGNEATLYIAPNSSLALYLGHSFTAVNSSHIINGIEGYEDARNLRMYGTSTCTEIVINNSGEFWGAIYAPDAKLEIKNSGATYGAFTGKSFEMKNSGEFYYDARLLDFDPTGELSFFQVERWWERGDDSI